MNPSVPRRLVSQSPMSGNLLSKYPDPFGPVPRAELGSESDQVIPNTSTSIQLCRLLFRLLYRPDEVHSGEVDLIGLLTATVKQVLLGRLQMRPL